MPSTLSTLFQDAVREARERSAAMAAKEKRYTVKLLVVVEVTATNTDEARQRAERFVSDGMTKGWAEGKPKPAWVEANKTAKLVR